MNTIDINELGGGEAVNGLAEKQAEKAEKQKNGQRNQLVTAEKQAEKAEKQPHIPLGMVGGAARSPSLDAPLALAPKEHRGRRAIVAGDLVYRCGSRAVLRRHDEVVVAKQAGWVLVEVTGWARDGWMSLKLIRTRAAKKNVYYLGAKDGRLSRNRDGQSLDKQFPEMEAWILKELNRYLKLNSEN